MRCVLAHHFTVAKALAWRSAIEENPPYQRESSLWSLDKQQLFVDSLLNGYDVPKIYLHDLRGKHPTKVYTIVDGKQRLTTIWRFLGDEFPLAPDFRIVEANLPDLPPTTPPPLAGMRFSEFHPAWQQVLRLTYISVVLIQNATEDDIEDLFSRLNNGEPLNAAEKRNAMGGDMAQLIRELAHRPFFADRLRFSNARYQHLDLAARMLLIEAADARGADGQIPDLKGKALDEFVRANRRMTKPERTELAGRVDARLGRLEAIFGHADHLLGAQSYVPLYYLFVRELDRSGAVIDPDALRTFLEEFQRIRKAELDKPEESQDAALVEFSHLMQHGTNERRSLERRLAILGAVFERSRPGGPG